MPCKHLVCIEYTLFPGWYSMNVLFLIDYAVLDVVIDSFLAEIPKAATSDYPTPAVTDKGDDSDDGSDGQVDTDEICDDHTESFSFESETSDAATDEGPIEDHEDLMDEILAHNDRQVVSPEPVAVDSLSAVEVAKDQAVSTEPELVSPEPLVVESLPIAEPITDDDNKTETGMDSSDEMVCREDTQMFEVEPKEDEAILEMV